MVKVVDSEKLSNFLDELGMPQKGLSVLPQYVLFQLLKAGVANPKPSGGQVNPHLNERCGLYVWEQRRQVWRTGGTRKRMLPSTESQSLLGWTLPLLWKHRPDLICKRSLQIRNPGKQECKQVSWYLKQ